MNARKALKIKVFPRFRLSGVVCVLFLYHNI